VKYYLNFWAVQGEEHIAELNVVQARRWKVGFMVVSQQVNKREELSSVRASPNACPHTLHFV
jgi:hypothetical protein